MTTSIQQLNDEIELLQKQWENISNDPNSDYSKKRDSQYRLEALKTIRFFLESEAKS